MQRRRGGGRGGIGGGGAVLARRGCTGGITIVRILVEAPSNRRAASGDGAPRGCRLRMGDCATPVSRGPWRFRATLSPPPGRQVMRIIIATTLTLFLAACLEEPPAEPTITTDPSQHINIPDELRLQPPTEAALAHSNCGHMLYCSSGGRAIYCYYRQSQTGCTLQNIVDDFNSDCQFVCGHTLCLNATIQACN
jgi:hypothetical protein